MLSNGKGKVSRLVQDVYGLLWYHHFNLGIKYRMGCIWKPNKGFSTELLIEMLTEKARNEVTEFSEKHTFTVFVCYAVVSYVLSLQGNECVLLDIDGMRKSANRNTEKYFWICLLGKLKGEDMDRQHNIPCSPNTNSGIKVRRVVQRLIEEKEKLGILRRSAVSDWEGKMYTAGDVDNIMHDLLENIFEVKPTLFPPDIENKESIIESYHCF